MLNVQEVLSLVQAVSLWIIFIYSFRRVNRLEAALLDFPEALGESIKMSILGFKSGRAKQEKVVGKALMKDLVNQQSPILGFLMDQFPELGNLLQENPQLIPIAIQYLGKLGGGIPLNGGQPQPTNNHNPMARPMEL